MGNNPRGQYGGVVVSTIAWVLSSCSGFLAQSKDMHSMLIVDYESTVGVNVTVNRCLSAGALIGNLSRVYTAFCCVVVGIGSSLDKCRKKRDGWMHVKRL